MIENLIFETKQIRFKEIKKQCSYKPGSVQASLCLPSIYYTCHHVSLAFYPPLHLQ